MKFLLHLLTRIWKLPHILMRLISAFIDFFSKPKTVLINPGVKKVLGFLFASAKLNT